MKLCLLIGLLLPLTLEAQIDVYFNTSIDTSLAWPQGNLGQGDEDFSRIVIDHIESARFSVDVALFNLNMDRVTDALIAAKERGVHVRVIGHVENVIKQESRFLQLADAHIPVASNPRAEQGEVQPLMHNKFFIIDGRAGAPDDAAAITITGSWNATTAQTYYDPNNLVVIRDSAIASAYTREFEEMWGSQSDEYDSLAARFGSSKQDDTDHIFTLADGTRVTLYFSPSDGTTERIGEALAGAETSIYTANLTFTNRELAETLQARKNAGVKDVRCLIDNVDDIGSRFDFLSTFADAYDWQRDGLLHHKYGIVDAMPPGSRSDQSVITGSHNWTFSAETINDENTLIIHSERIANQFLQEFAVRYREAGGTRPFVMSSSRVTVDTADRLALHVLPHPSRDVLLLSAMIPIGTEGDVTISDLLGRTIVQWSVDAARYVHTWNADAYATGFYLVTLRQGDHLVWKMVQVVK